MAAVSVPEPRVLMIAPWDASQLKAIEKAIQASDLGINPQNDGKTIRLSFPQLTEDRRKELTKTVAKKSEDCKVVVRGIRRDEIEKYKAMKKKSEITEDDLKGIEKDIQDIIDACIAADQAKKLANMQEE
jgi:ribosome recycling factor